MAYMAVQLLPYPSAIMLLMKITRTEQWLIWLAALVIAALTFALYLAAERAAAGGETLLPLDDVYIHFQYARSIAEGQPYVYNVGQPPTSGATSFLYPYLLAIGYALGFRELSLAVWALLIGATAFAASIALVYWIARLRAPVWIAALMALTFALNGAFAWHAMSGMETMLATLFTLLTLYGMAAERVGVLSAGGALLALTRPEGAIGAGLAILWLLFLTAKTQRKSPFAFFTPLRFKNLFLIFLPILAIGIQPFVNILVTGSAVATGNQAKSLLAALAPQADILRRILDNIVRIWHEWLLPSGEPTYGVSIVVLLSVLGWLSIFLNHRNTEGEKKFSVFSTSLWLIVFLWLLGGTLLISTLDTAFWHFKRYQIPFMALFYPLAAWGLAWLARRLEPRRHEGHEEKKREDVSTEGRRKRITRRQGLVGTPFWMSARLFAALLVGVMALAWTAVVWETWRNAYALNVGYIYSQPYPMARWLAANTSPIAMIAVHDVGMMRYRGERMTLDIVGLTTPGAAEYWRQGPGAVGEFIVRNRPDYIASYGEGHGLGLSYLQRTDLYAEMLESYSIELDPIYNVALAAPTQGIYQPRWAAADAAAQPQQASYADAYADMTLIDTLNVADIADERAHAYTWRSERAALGFPTEFYQFGAVMDGGRRINGEEAFTLTTQAGQDLILLTRLHAGHEGAFDVYANDQLVGTRVIPFLPGSWLEVATLIPAESITSDTTHIRIAPRLPEGDYMPYRHWAYQGDYTPQQPTSFPLARFDNGAIVLVNARIEHSADALMVNFSWASSGAAQSDYIWFVHVVDADDGIIAQTDRRVGAGTLPPGNWLPGIMRDQYTVHYSDMAAGTYRIAVGFYQPNTFERMSVVATNEAGFTVTSDGRLIIGEIEVVSDE
jgi:hypothetical protein